MCCSRCPYENYWGDCTLSSLRSKPTDAHCVEAPGDIDEEDDIISREEDVFYEDDLLC